MNKTKTCVTVLVVLLSGWAVTAQVDTQYPTDQQIDRSADRVPGHHDVLFEAHELQFDLFGSLSLGQETIENVSGDRVEDDGRLGAGAGISYFPLSYLGIGADAYTENTQHSFVDNVSGNLIFRIPFDRAHLAPYFYGGGGHQFDPRQKWFGQLGAGLEVRIVRNFGIFADARYVFVDESKDHGLGRLGVRFRF